MVRLRDLRKKDVIVADTGINLGRPVDVLVDIDSHEVALLVMSYGRVPEMAVVCPASAIGQFHHPAMTVASLSHLHVAYQERELLAHLEEGVRLRGRRVISSQGRRIGTISAIEIDDTGKVTRYRVRKPRFGLLRPTFQMSPADVRGLGEIVVMSETGFMRSRNAKPKEPKAATK